MGTGARQNIFSSVSTDAFIGRSDSLARLIASISAGNSLAVLAAPSAGTSELLRQAYDELFRDNGEIVPFYFEVLESDLDVDSLSSRFLAELLLQGTAFRTRDTSWLWGSLPMDAAVDLVPAADAAWIDDVIRTSGCGQQKGRQFFRSCLGSAVRAARVGLRFALLFDAAHNLQYLENGDEVLDDLIFILSKAGIPIIVAGHRRYLYGRTLLPRMDIEPLSLDEAGRILTDLAGSHNVAIDDATRDMVAVQLNANPLSIQTIVSGAAERDRKLDSFAAFQKVYTDELFGGRLGRKVNSGLQLAIPDRSVRNELISMLGRTVSAIPIEYLEKRLGEGPDLDEIISRLHYLEIGTATPTSVDFSQTAWIYRDHMLAHARLTSGESRALVVGETLNANIQRAPLLMSEGYRSGAALDIGSILQLFQGRRVSSAAMNYREFKEHRGLDDKSVLEILQNDTQNIPLPRLVYTVAAAFLYPKLAELEGGRVTAGFGSDDSGEPIVILAAEIDSKLEAPRALADFWCDRLEMAAVHCGLKNYKFWLIAPEGFDDASTSLLGERGSFGSSRRQVEMLIRLLSDAEPDTAAAEEYDLTIPMGSENELIAARAVEEIAVKHGLPPKEINQVKTAIVEACINASEHSKSPDGKIHLKFVTEKRRLLTTVSNRGLRLQDKKTKISEDREQRRGWGLQLMRSLMDEVIVQDTDDGTSLILIKNFPHSK